MSGAGVVKHPDQAQVAQALCVSAAQLREWLERGEGVIVLDVRPAQQRAEWAIPGSLHADVYDALWAGAPDALAHVRLPAGGPVVAVCGEGKTSLLAALQLRARGVEALSLTGGMKAWSLAWNEAEVPLPAARAQVVQLRRTGKGCLSYLIGSRGQALVVDPALEPDVYRQAAERRGWSIVEVLDTHIHADHLSRGRALANRCGATYRLPEQGRASFPFAALRDGDVVALGEARVTARRMPGHTMESTVYDLEGRALFTGDTLFPDSVGRPDLEAKAGEAEARARALHASLKRLLALPSEALVLAGHASSPVAFDGRPVAAPLGEVGKRLAVTRQSEDEFVRWILGRIPPTPANHTLIVRLNEAGVLPEGELADFEAGANRCAVR